MAFENTARTGFATAADYGWCYTDRRGKKPKQMRVLNVDGSKRRDYFLDERYRKYTEYFFDKFELPMPINEMVYRGNSQDLLFLDSLGLVVRTGPIDIIDMVHPGVIQPLYWMPFDNTDHVIAIYPGIQLSEHLYDRESKGGFDKERHKLIEFMKKTGQKTKDGHVDQNFGYCNDLLVVLDAEEWFFGSLSSVLEYKKNAYSVYTDADFSPHIAIQQVMVELYDGTPEFRKWMPAFQYHQPLREQIHTALNENDVNKRHQLLGEFYQRCRDCVEGKDPEVALYRPWTGSLDDNKPKNGRNATFPRPA